MTTSELKAYIDRILGNSIRLLLPSYWWKRLFGMVVDKVDEVEQSTSKLIDSKVEEVDAKIIFVDIYNNKANETNAKAFSAIKNCVLNGKPYVVVGGTSALLFVSEGAMFVEDICSLSFGGFDYNETIDGTTTRKHHTATLYADGHVVLGTAVDFAIDSKLSDSSENAVQNKAIKAYVDTQIATAITNTLNTPV